MNRRKLNIIIAAVLTLALTLLCGCKGVGGNASAQIYALDTVIDITAYGEHSEDAVNAAKSEIRRLEQLLSVTDGDSDIYRINHAEGKAVEVSSETYELIEKAVEISELTDGAFDITIYNAVKLWGFTTDEYRVPAESELSSVLNTVGYERINLLGDNSVAVKKDTQLDLGGIAKGYIADKAAEAMKTTDIEYGVVSLGGNVRTVGNKPQNESFIIGIRHPEESGHFIEVATQECSVITSGGYQRNFTENGVTYHHIIDPETGKPSVNDAVSVTVIGEDGTLCDALSTAIYIGGTEYAEELYRTNRNFEYVILTADGDVYASEGLKGQLTLAYEYTDLHIEYK